MKNIKNNIFILLIFIIMIVDIYFLYIESIKLIEERKIKNFFNQITGIAKIDKYTIYGNHFNLEGYLNIDKKTSKVILVLKNFENEKEIPLEYSIDNNEISFKLSRNINEGIDLDTITDANYYLFIKIISDNKTLYYTLENNTIYNDLEYYTITRNNKNYKIDLIINQLEIEDINIPYFKLTSALANNNNVYDIVIDPGHGGRDPGAISPDKKHHESDINLLVSKEIKKGLENIGLKVKLTREEDITIASYGSAGRAVIPNNVKAKLLLSIHSNSSVNKLNKGGFEIYTPPFINKNFAQNFADNIVNIANTTYSANEQDKVTNGVYERTYDNDGIKDAIKLAKENGYEPYNITTSTPALYMIREPGGIMTNAYIDGRNSGMGVNPYFNSNIATETYLLELGYLNNNKDLNNMLNNYHLYAEAIVKTIKDNYSLN